MPFVTSTGAPRPDPSKRMAEMRRVGKGPSLTLAAPAAKRQDAITGHARGDMASLPPSGSATIRPGPWSSASVDGFLDALNNPPGPRGNGG